MKSAIVGMAILALIGTQTMAQTTAPLAAGKPAGVQEAQRHHRVPLLLTLGVAAIAAAGIIVAVQQGGNASCGSACSSTGTSP